MRTQRSLSDATKEKMRAAKTGSKNPNYGKSLTEETRRKISRSMLEYWKTIPY